ncbi:MAG: hypothetical protein LBQ11_01745 [Candidatus Nomurabacteria bacterium]|jgi:hypothetical protein|nr:hypothetical protein [Candidatus Nomurabacteria bacterium]
MKIIAHPAPKPLSESAPTLGFMAAGILAIMLVLQLVGLGKVLSGLSAQFDGNDGWSITVVVIALVTELAALPFLLRKKLSYLAGMLSGMAAVIAPLVWLLVVIWSVGLADIAAVQFGIAGCFNIGWWLLILNVAWLFFNFYTVRQLNIDKVWYGATGLKARAEMKKSDKK